MTKQEENIDEEKIKRVLSIDWGIRGDGINADEVTRLLGIPPSSMYRKGEKYQTRDGRSFERFSTVWHLRSDGDVTSDHLNDHAEYLLNKLEPKIKIIQELRQKADYCFVWITYKHGDDCVASFGIKADLLARLAALASDVNYSIIYLPELAT